MTRRAWSLFLALSVLWGVPYLLIKVAVAEIDPVVVAFGRTFLGALILLPVAVAQHALRPVAGRWKWLLLYTVVEMVGPWWLLGHAETRLTSSTAGLLLAVVPLIAAVILVSTGRDRFDGRRLLGLGIGLIGVIALVGLDVHLDDLPSVGAVGMTAVGYAAGPIIINRKLADLPPMGVITASLIVAATVFLPFAIWLRPAHLSVQAGLSVVGLAVLCTAIAFLALFALIAEAGPARATVITYINPAVAITLGILILGERFTIGIAIGFPLVILGAVLATAKARSKPAPAEGPLEEPVAC